MQAIRKLINAARHFRMMRRYDYPVLFFLVQSVVTLTKFSFLLAVFVAGYLYIQKQVTPEQFNREALVVTPVPATAIASASPSLAAPQPAIAAPEPLFAAASNQQSARGTSAIAEPIAPDSAVALLLAKLDQTRSDAANLEVAGLANREVQYRARVQWTNVRQEPSVAAPIIVSLDTNQQVRIVMQKGSWVQILSDEIDTKGGYVLASLLEPVVRVSR